MARTSAELQPDEVIAVEELNNIANSKLVYKDSTGAITGLTVGTNLAVAGGALNASGGGGTGDVTGPDTNTDGYIPLWDGADSKTLKNGIPTSTFTPFSQNVLIKDPTGFSSPELVIVNGDAGARTITLTGTPTGYYQGTLVSALVSGWTSPEHDDTAGSNFFLYYNGTNFLWAENSFPGFDKLLIAFALWDASNTTWIYSRECHGLMNWQSHKEFHETIGTYKSSGGTIPAASYTLNSTTATDRRPDIDETTIYDEDLPTTNAAVTSKLYTKLTLGNSAVAALTVETAEIIPLSTNNPYYNTFSSPNWGQTLMPANSVATVWVYAMPVCAGTACQKYRYFFVQPQWITQATNSSAGALATALATEKLRLPSELSLGSFAIAAPEFVAIGRIAITYTGGNWSLSDVTLLTGNKYSQIGSPSGNYLSAVSTDGTLTGSGTGLDPLGVNVNLPVTTIELGHASDTTLSRVSAGVIAVEGVRVITSAGTTSGTILKNNGTTFVASTETYAAPGTSGNVLTSDGTNWTSAAPTAGGGSFWTLMPGTPTRVGNTSFTVTGDVTAYVAKGMIIKWTEAATVRYGMVSIPSTYSAPDTTITIIGNTMASIDASSLKYAMVGAEVFEKNFNVITGSVGATGTDVGATWTAFQPYIVIGAEIWTNSAGTTNNTTIDINKNGTTMFTTKPTLATTVASSPTPFTADTATALALGDKVTFDIDAFQTTNCQDLYTKLYLIPTRYANLT